MRKTSTNQDDGQGIGRMAGQGDTNSTVDPLGYEPGVQDLATHERGYEKFLGWFKWGAIASFVIAAIVVFLLAR